MMIELERTFLLKKVPSGLKNCKSKEIIDIYIPKEYAHPKLRIRKNGEKYEITKKEPAFEGDFSKFIEQTILLKEKEFLALSHINGKKVHKIRYFYDYKSYVAEIDVFLGDLKGLIIADFEFKNEEEENSFVIPDFCLADVTHEEFIAGGFICGKSYEDIEENLKRYNYVRLSLD